MVDPRQVVGGEVWAKAPTFSRDLKPILGNQFEKKWVRGTVVRVEKRKTSHAAKRSTTYIVARYPCKVHDGVQQYKENELALQVLKAKDPNEATPPPTNNEGVSTAMAGPEGTTNTMNNNTTDDTTTSAMPPLTGGGDILNSPPPAEMGGKDGTTQEETRIPGTVHTTATTNIFRCCHD
jgi:hypothetical protein